MQNARTPLAQRAAERVRLAAVIVANRIDPCCGWALRFAAVVLPLQVLRFVAKAASWMTTSVVSRVALENVAIAARGVCDANGGRPTEWMDQKAQDCRLTMAVWLADRTIAER